MEYFFFEIWRFKKTNQTFWKKPPLEFLAFFMKSLVVGVREQGKALWKKDGGFFIGNTCTQIAKFFHKIQHSCTIATSLLNNRLLFRMLQIEVAWSYYSWVNLAWMNFFGFNQKASYRKEQKCVVRINLVWIFFAIVFGVTVLKLKMFLH